MSVPSVPTQCDGCKAGVPTTWSMWPGDDKPIPMHRMGKAGGYPDYMVCQASKYADIKTGA